MQEYLKFVSSKFKIELNCAFGDNFEILWLFSILNVCHCRGLVHYTDLLPLLRQIDPPLGFGSKCPDLLAYKRLVRMNMPVDEEGKVHFKSTLFSLIRINLQIFMRSMEEMDQADQELRAAIQKSWPMTRGGTPPMVDLLVPPPEETGPGKLTVGKIYGGMLILENWKLSRFGQGFNNNKNNSHSNNIPVRVSILFKCSINSWITFLEWQW